MRASGLGVSSILAFGLLAATSVAVAAQGEHPSGEPPASSGAERVHGWVSADPDNAPAGLYSWRVRPTNGWSRSNWMHKIPPDYSGERPNSVELTFYAGTVPDRPTMESRLVSREWWAGNGPFDAPERVSDVRTETWLLDIGGTRVAILLDAYADTDQALVDEARAVIASIVVEPTESGNQLVFRLQEGWDNG